MSDNKYHISVVSLILSLNLGSEEMAIEEYVQFTREEIVDVEHNMAQLVDLAWCMKVCLGLDLNEEPMEGNDVDDQPTPIIKILKLVNMPNY
jgi:hypothetical protein